MTDILRILTDAHAEGREWVPEAEIAALIEEIAVTEIMATSVALWRAGKLRIAYIDGEMAFKSASPTAKGQP